MDLASAELYTSEQRFPMWRELTTEDVALWTDPGDSPGGFWSVLSHRACRRLLAPKCPFTSEYGTMIGFDKDHPDRAGGQMLVTTDGRHHAYLRRLIASFLSRNETTRHSAAACFHAAAATAGLLNLIDQRPAITDSAVEEIIRWGSPAMHVLRVASADFVISNRTIHAGEPVVAWLPAANRDERLFSQPDQVIPGRQPNQHIAFGHGLHHWLGTALARLELNILLRMMARDLKSVTLADSPIWLRSNVIQGYLHLSAHLEWRK